MREYENVRDFSHVATEKKKKRKKKERETVKNEVQNLDEILFGCTVCANGAVVH